jgi:hypothetical protein
MTKYRTSRQDDAVFEKLLEWLRVLEIHVIELHEHRLVFERTREVVSNNTDISGNVFFESLNLWYANSMSISIRRLVDKDSRSDFLLPILTADKEKSGGDIARTNPKGVGRARSIGFEV